VSEYYVSAELLAAIRASGRSKREIASAVAQACGYAPISAYQVLTLGRRVPCGSNGRNTIVDAVCEHLGFPIEQALTSTPPPRERRPYAERGDNSEPTVNLTLLVPASVKSAIQRAASECGMTTSSFLCEISRKAFAPEPTPPKHDISADEIDRRYQAALAEIQARRRRLTPEDCHAGCSTLVGGAARPPRSAQKPKAA
jgi:transcriptional regulator of met regulon